MERRHQAMRTSGSTSACAEDFVFSRSSGFSSFFEQLFGAAAGQRGAAQGRRHTGGRTQDWSWNQPGADREARLALTLEEAAHGGEREISLSGPTAAQTKTYMVRI